MRLPDPIAPSSFRPSLSNALTTLTTSPSFSTSLLMMRTGLRWSKNSQQQHRALDSVEHQHISTTSAKSTLTLTSSKTATTGQGSEMDSETITSRSKWGNKELNIDPSPKAKAARPSLRFRRGGNSKGSDTSSLPTRNSLPPALSRVTTSKSVLKSLKNLAELDEDMLSGEEPDDPVLSLFRARTTQRVRFAEVGSTAGAAAGGTHVGHQQSILTSTRDTKNVTTAAPPEEDPLLRRPASPNGGSTMSIQRFLKGAIFTSSTEGDEADEEVTQEISKTIASARHSAEMVWESPHTSGASPEIVRTTAINGGKDLSLTVAFSENPQIRARINKLLNKARRAHHVHFRYEYALKCYLKALEMLTAAQYPKHHVTVTKAMSGLNSAHHALSSFKNSANIVKMGIKYEDQGELVRALKMYTVAYRIRRDSLSRAHPSLTVILNMLGSVQMKRGELDEAIDIYDLALKDSHFANDHQDPDDPEYRRKHKAPRGNLLTRSVTYREMGAIHERLGEMDEALNMYHRSLECIAQYKGMVADFGHAYRRRLDGGFLEEPEPEKQYSDRHYILEEMKASKHYSSFLGQTEVVNADNASGSLEMLIGIHHKGKKHKEPIPHSTSCYDVFFPHVQEEDTRKKAWRGKSPMEEEPSGDYADIDAALTIHQIAQLHRVNGEYNLAIASYNVALRGMKYALGNYHPNVAAILGNVGNLRKEMGDMDAAFEIYQQVLAIESYRLGLSHPDVTITLHNIATIDASRGNYDHALSLYRQVLSLQRKHFGEDDDSVAVTSACMGEVYERIGDLRRATECFEDSLRIKSAIMGRHSLDVARLLHKLGKLAFGRKDYHLADSFTSRALLVYRLNRLAEDDEWIIDANRDAADIDACIAMGQAPRFEC